MEQLSEFLGALAGDGCIAKNANKIEFSMHPTADVKYLKEYIAPIIINLFGKINLKFKIRAGASRLFFNSKIVKETLLTLGFPEGKKGDFNVMNVVKANKQLWPHFIRGFFDTDGCIFWDKRKIYLRPYPRICLYSISDKLMSDMNHMLLYLGFRTTMRKRLRKGRQHIELELYGYKNLKRWRSVISSSNPYKSTKLCLCGSVVER